MELEFSNWMVMMTSTDPWPDYPGTTGSTWGVAPLPSDRQADYPQDNPERTTEEEEVEAEIHETRGDKESGTDLDQAGDNLHMIPGAKTYEDPEETESERPTIEK